MKLTIVRGLPGSGKSTYAKSLGVFHVEADMFLMQNGVYKFDPNNCNRNHTLCADMIEKVLSINCDCVVSNTFTRIKEMQNYLELAEQYGADVEVVRMESKFNSIHGVPQDIIEKMKLRFADYDGEHIIK